MEPEPRKLEDQAVCSSRRGQFDQALDYIYQAVDSYLIQDDKKSLISTLRLGTLVLHTAYDAKRDERLLVEARIMSRVATQIDTLRSFKKTPKHSFN